MVKLSLWLSRFCKHLCTSAASGKRAFPVAAQKIIQAAIATGEKCHRAQVRLIVEPALPLGALIEKISSRERARELFAHHRIWDTEENVGILIYINLADRKVEIITDRSVGRVLHANDWYAVCQTMTSGFALGNFCDSAVDGIKLMNDLLLQHFPRQGSSSNELSNKPLIL